MFIDSSTLLTAGLVSSSLLFIAILYYKIFEAFCWKNHTKRLDMEKILVVLSFIVMICFAIAKWSDYHQKQVMAWDALDYKSQRAAETQQVTAQRRQQNENF